MIEEFKNMIGRSMTRVEGKVDTKSLTFHAYDGSVFRFYHEQDCCESCWIYDIVGDITDLCGSPIFQAELVSSEQNGGEMPAECSDTWTWSFYKFRTAKGDVTVSWLGTSNGYYSEKVSFEETLVGS